ncbi:MAG TPA: DUF3592 domain-containing protein [Melioribacteraceae bacterium]|nr:DUF3592 domain-containing protein [Melioribacteraceae bacterium]
MKPLINPKLKYEYYGIKYLKYVFPILGVLAFLSFFTYFIFFSGSLPSEDKYVIIIAPFVLMILFLSLGFVIAKQEKKILITNDILNNTTPIKKWLNSTNIINFKGSVCYMTDTENDENKEGQFVVVEVSKNKRLKKLPIYLDYYFNSNYDNNLIMFDDGKNIFSGFILPKTEAKEQLDKSIKFAPILAGLGGLVPFIIVIVLFFQINNLTKLAKYYNSSLKWNVVEAQIIKSDIEEIQIKRDKRTIPGYNNVVKYQYSFQNINYTGETISFDYSPYTNFENAKSMQRFLSFGKSIPIFINPNLPNTSYIIPPNVKAVINKKNLLIYITAIVFLLGIILDVFLIFYIKKVKTKQLNLKKEMERR